MNDVSVSPSACSAFLKQNNPSIIDDWKGKVKSTVPPALIGSDMALVDHIPSFINKLGDALLALQDHAPAIARVGKQHGEQRAQFAHYSIYQVLYEYKLLRQVVFRRLRILGRLSDDIQDTLLNAFDDAENEAAESFMKIKTDNDREQLLTVQSERDKLHASHSDLTQHLEHNSRFIATLSHDLRNPIGSVKMALELLELENPFNASGVELAAMMKRGLDRAEVLLKNLLDANSIDLGKAISLDRAPCDLHALLAPLLKDLILTLDRNIRLVCATDVRGYWDGPYLSRLVENLVSNAVKYGLHKSDITVIVTQSTTTTSIAIHNSGKPISQADQESLFEPYFRTNEAHAGKKKGWGLGLTVVKAVVDAHRGEIHVNSTEEEGTTFTVTLPNKG